MVGNARGWGSADRTVGQLVIYHRLCPCTALQLLITLYSFLAGVAVSTGHMMWLLPLATAVAAAAHWVVGAASRAALPFYRALPAQRAALWCVDLVHLAYSTIAGECCLGAASERASLLSAVCGSDPLGVNWGAADFPLLIHARGTLPLPAAALVACYLLACPRSLHLAGGGGSGGLLPGTWCADVAQGLVAASAGFCGYVLWAEVSGRLYRSDRYSHMVHYTLLLILFSAAAYKSEVRCGVAGAGSAACGLILGAELQEQLIGHQAG